MRNMPKFKAKPYDPTYTEIRSNTLSRSVEKKPLTEPQPFNFATDYRIKSLPLETEESKPQKHVVRF